ncbi:MAG: hypothetical protein H7288_05745 [Kineosporiaceae bacterium]|nr:hypothetical protein [Aeromicrobium sp.]
MIVALFTAKGSPGATSSALALTAVWSRPAVLLDADPSGSDLVYRCATVGGGPVAAVPNILGLASSLRGDRSTQVESWTQRLGCGVDLVAGVTSPGQARGMADLWPSVASAATASEVDVIVDLGRLHRQSPTVALVAAAALVIPVLAATLSSLTHTREVLKDLPVRAGSRTTPLLVGRARTAAADGRDVDDVMAAAGLMTAATVHLPFDHPGLCALQDGANPAGRSRASQLVRAARSAANQLLDDAGLAAAAR